MNAEATSPRAALFQTSDGSLHITLDGLDHRLRRRRLVVEVADLDIVAQVAALEADLLDREQRAGGTR